MDPIDQLVVLSDHGFAPFRKAVNLNRWLADAGYLVFIPGAQGSDALFGGVDWAKTQAYALGLNGIFINQLGREPKGSVSVFETKALKAKIIEQLVNVTDPETGESVVRQVFDREDIYPGLAIAEAPDLVIGYERNYRASWQTTLGGAPPDFVETNQEKWSGDHCIDPALVPGVLFTSFPLPSEVNSIQDIPGLILQLLDIRVGN
jgi:predicted AlkP superfamily phosphohydrolase/phosphomutase